MKAEKEDAMVLQRMLKGMMKVAETVSAAAAVVDHMVSSQGYFCCSVAAAEEQIHGLEVDSTVTEEVVEVQTLADGDCLQAVAEVVVVAFESFRRELRYFMDTPFVCFSLLQLASDPILCAEIFPVAILFVDYSTSS